MISKLGTVNEVEVDNEYTKFNPLYPNESIDTTHTVNGVSWTGYNFIPKYALNMRTGKVYMNDAELRGKITANSGTIGGWEIGPISGLKAKSEYQYIELSPGYDRWVEGYIEAGLDHTSKGLGKNGVRISPSKLYTYESSGQGQTPPTVTNQLNTDGSGSLGRGGISWDEDGDFTITNKFTDTILNALDAGYHTQLHSDDTHDLKSYIEVFDENGVSEHYTARLYSNRLYLTNDDLHDTSELTS